MTTYPGAAASEIETNVTKIMENALTSVVDQWRIYNIGANRKIPIDTYLANNEHVLVVESKRCRMDLEEFKSLVLSECDV